MKQRRERSNGEAPPAGQPNGGIPASGTPGRRGRERLARGGTLLSQTGATQPSDTAIRPCLLQHRQRASDLPCWADGGQDGGHCGGIVWLQREATGGEAARIMPTCPRYAPSDPRTHGQATSGSSGCCAPHAPSNRSTAASRDIRSSSASPMGGCGSLTVRPGWSVPSGYQLDRIVSDDCSVPPIWG